MAQQTFPMESSSLKQHAMKGMTMKRNTSESTMSSSSSNNVRNRATMIRQKHANSQELKTRIRSYRRVSIESDDKGLHDDAEAVRKSLQTLEEVMNAMNARTSSGSGLRKAVSIGSMAVLHQSQSSNSISNSKPSSSKSIERRRVEGSSRFLPPSHWLLTPDKNTTWTSTWIPRPNATQPFPSKRRRTQQCSPT
ncbi:unknown protein [Seminavis robusta]|uniref:Uncharacterized protein n=1 Tax=Seminavis robusta TaxID=568900 RepID=A0A9N8DX16_9STRA|nr:unknown protein [Seminavis robusta]|eukprot:Sro310_g114150.1 n/a (194) ;mRNA; f:62994-63575